MVGKKNSITEQVILTKLLAIKPQAIACLTGKRAQLAHVNHARTGSSRIQSVALKQLEVACGDTRLHALIRMM